MCIVPSIKMHDEFEKEYVVQRERRLDALSLDLALYSKTIVHFNSNIADKL